MGSPTSEGVRRLIGRVSRSMGANLHVQMEERHLPRLSGGCHGLRWPGTMIRSEMLLEAVCLLGRDHARQHDLP
jgi:hypothetical protein